MLLLQFLCSVHAQVQQYLVYDYTNKLGLTFSLIPRYNCNYNNSEKPASFASGKETTTLINMLTDDNGPKHKIQEDKMDAVPSEVLLDDKNNLKGW